MTFPTWSEAQLQAERDVAEGRFKLERRGEGPDAYYAACREARSRVSEALSLTTDLRHISGEQLVENVKLWQTMRYLCAPPISEEDLWTLVGVGKKFKKVQAGFADKTARVLKDLIDTFRFPWIADNRAPTDEERSAAVLASSTILAHETLKTERRRNTSRIQEDAVCEALENAGFVFDPSRKAIKTLDQLARGSFSRERIVEGAKCDVPVRLHDGRLLALECKVSNGPKNGWKRLQREVGGKSGDWSTAFGTQIVTGAVLAGVFDTRCLVKTQDEQRVSIFWQHDLGKLVSSIASAA
jgi:hypothetical protein